MHCSETERRADDATRDVETWLKCYFMQDHVGDEFEGTVSGVDGLRPLRHARRALHRRPGAHLRPGQDYFQYDQQRHLLSGERTGVRYQLGARVKVRVVRVDLETAKIDFVLVDGGPRRGPARASCPTPCRCRSQKPRDQDKKQSRLDTQLKDGGRKKGKR